MKKNAAGNCFDVGAPNCPYWAALLTATLPWRCRPVLTPSPGQAAQLAARLMAWLVACNNTAGPSWAIPQECQVLSSPKAPCVSGSGGSGSGRGSGRGSGSLSSASSPGQTAVIALFLAMSPLVYWGCLVCGKATAKVT